MRADMYSLVEEVSANFKRGTTEMLLLSLLTQKDWYAYELAKALKQLSKGRFDIQGPSLYTVLYRMESKQFVSTWTEQVGRRARIHYHLLPDGEAYLKQILAEYLLVTGGVMDVLRASVPDLMPQPDIHAETKGDEQ